MGFFSSIGSAISSVGSAISSACSSVVSGLSSVVSNFAPLANALSVAIPHIGTLVKVAQAIQIVATILGVMEKDDTIEDLGDRAMQAQDAGIHPQDFSTYKEYVSAIKNFELDPKKSAETKETDKLVAGIGVQYWGFEETLGVGSGEILVKALNSPDYFTGERLSVFLDKVESIGDVIAYFDGKLNKTERVAVEEKLVEAEKSISPEKSDFTIYNELLNHTDEKH